jgi:hypothetical protein
VEIEIAGRRLRPGEPGVIFYPAEKRLTVELADIEGRLPVAPGEARCRVSAADYAGNRMEKPFEWTWRLDLSKDTQPPAAPRPIYLPSERLIFEDFERGQGEFAEWRRATCYRAEGRGRGEAGAGRWYLISTDRRWRDNNNESQIYPHPFDPERSNYLAFDYRLRPGADFSFMLQVANKMRMLGFSTGRWNWRNSEGELARAVADGVWHRAEIDLRKLRELLPAGADGRPPLVQNLLAAFSTSEGMDLDNFVLGSSRSRGAEFVWDAPAVASGIAGYSWSLDDRAETVPPERLSGSERRAAFRGLKPGRHWFHLRARSGAGLWGATAHLKFTVGE